MDGKTFVPGKLLYCRMYHVQQFIVNFTLMRPINGIKLILSYVMTEINKFIIETKNRVHYT